ncbi:MAG TPA: hypothetical protein VFH45_03975, partial [Acidimicrobiales bacterium]|nr:hypothetical protein [Acidimicrobiales bacterium]
WMAQMAEQRGIEASLLATRAELEDLLAGRPTRLERSWRRQLVADPVRRLAAGEAALAFDGRGGLVLEARSHQPVELGDGPADDAPANRRRSHPGASTTAAEAPSTPA